MEEAETIIGIFRLEDGRIAERWDVMQQIPDDARNGRF